MKDENYDIVIEEELEEVDVNITSHQNLSDLDYENSGHTGFASAAQVEELQKEINNKQEALTEQQLADINTINQKQNQLSTEQLNVLDTTPAALQNIQNALNQVSTDLLNCGVSLKVTSVPAEFKYTMTLINKNGAEIGNIFTLDLPLESVVVDGNYNNITKQLTLVLQNGNTITIPFGDLITGLVNQADFDNFVKLMQDFQNSVNVEINQLKANSLTAQERTSLLNLSQCFGISDDAVILLKPFIIPNQDRYRYPAKDHVSNFIPNGQDAWGQWPEFPSRLNESPSQDKNATLIRLPVGLTPAKLDMRLWGCSGRGNSGQPEVNADYMWFKRSGSGTQNYWKYMYSYLEIPVAYRTKGCKVHIQADIQGYTTASRGEPMHVCFSGWAGKGLDQGKVSNLNPTDMDTNANTGVSHIEGSSPQHNLDSTHRAELTIIARPRDAIINLSFIPLYADGGFDSELGQKIGNVYVTLEPFT